MGEWTRTTLGSVTEWKSGGTPSKRVKQSVTIDWQVRENARAHIRVLVKRVLRKRGWGIEFGGAAGLAGLVIAPALLHVRGGAGIEISGFQAEDVEPGGHEERLRQNMERRKEEIAGRRPRASGER